MMNARIAARSGWRLQLETFWWQLLSKAPDPKLTHHSEYSKNLAPRGLQQSITNWKSRVARREIFAMAVTFASQIILSVDLERQQEQLLKSRYGGTILKKHAFLGHPGRGGKKFFDSGDWGMVKQGKIPDDAFLTYNCPIESLPIKKEPSPYVARYLSNLDVVTSSKDRVLHGAEKNTVLDY